MPVFAVLAGVADVDRAVFAADRLSCCSIAVSCAAPPKSHQSTPANIRQNNFQYICDFWVVSNGSL